MGCRRTRSPERRETWGMIAIGNLSKMPMFPAENVENVEALNTECGRVPAADTTITTTAAKNVRRIGG
jgi:hypothetical protein